MRLNKPLANSTIVVRLPSWVGDAVMATPALRALRRAYPAARIVLHGRPKLTELLAGATVDGRPHFDATIAAHSGSQGVSQNIAALREAEADAVVVLPHSFRTAWECYRAGVPRRLGYAREGRGFLLTQRLTPHTARFRRRQRIFPVPMALQYCELLAAWGAAADDQGLELGIPASLAAEGAVTLSELGVSEGDRLVVLNPGAAFGPSKVWPTRSFAAVGDALLEKGYQVLVLSGPGEEALATEIADQMTRPALLSTDKLIPLAQLKVIMQRAAVVITSDAGPRHIATAVATPTVVLMGPTDPRYSHSHLNQCQVLRNLVPCAPCHLKQCPIDHRCMSGISVSRVLELTERAAHGGTC